MFKLTYENLQNPMFARSLGKLASFPGYASPKVAYGIAKIVKKVNDERQTFEKLYNDMLKLHAEVDEKTGDVKDNGQGIAVWKSDEEKKKFETKMKEFVAIEFEVPNNRLTLQDIGDVKLSPSEMLALESLINPMEDVK
jgi:hypothetical protein